MAYLFSHYPNSRREIAFQIQIGTTPSKKKSISRKKAAFKTQLLSTRSIHSQTQSSLLTISPFQRVLLTGSTTIVGHHHGYSPLPIEFLTRLSFSTIILIEFLNLLLYSSKPLFSFRLMSFLSIKLKSHTCFLGIPRSNLSFILKYSLIFLNKTEKSKLIHKFVL